ncbi:MAG: HAD family hydrolase [Lachnospiraceae bacterium]|nr:HAD family hydrolase [Lachnospiraceae bacterium]
MNNTLLDKYQNFIFDLYGTLLDIETNEHKPSLWRFMAECYNTYGCEWKAKNLHEAFFKADREERELLKIKTGYEHPEIKLERVFARMFLECPKYHKSRTPITLKNQKTNHELILFEHISQKNKKISDKNIVDELATSDTVTFIANAFRIYSYRRLRPYRNTIPFLKYLKEHGKRVYLLSNAQAVFTVPEIEKSGLMPYFDGIYISSDYQMMKPQKEFMELLLDREGLDPKECVMTGNDISSDLRIAVRCGMDSILLNTWKQTDEEIHSNITKMLKEEGLSLRSKKTPKLTVVGSGDIGELIYGTDSSATVSLINP